MPIPTKKTATEKYPGGAIVSDQVKSYADDPYFVEKANKARETLKKAGLPGQKDIFKDK
jgi:hypothetical protein